MKVFLKMALAIMAALAVVWLLVFLIDVLVNTVEKSEGGLSQSLDAATLFVVFGLVLFAVPGAILWYISYRFFTFPVWSHGRKLFISAGLAGVLCPLFIVLALGGFNRQSMQGLLPLMLLVLTVALLSALCYWLLFMVLPRHKKTSE